MSLSRIRRAVPLAAWLAALVLAIAAFTRMGSGPLAAPALTAPSGWGSWVAGREPEIATAAVLRLVVLALAWYLLATTLLGAAARLTEVAALVRLSDAVTAPVVRSVLQRALGAGLATAVVASGLAVAASRPVPEPAPLAAAAPLAPPSLQPAAPAAGPFNGATDPTPGPPGIAPMPPRPAPDTPRSDAAIHTVRSGEHLWMIAHEHLHAVGAAAATDARVAAYWRRVIDANRDRLVVADNPDLILPGQRIVLPEVSL